MPLYLLKLQEVRKDKVELDVVLAIVTELPFVGDCPTVEEQKIFSHIKRTTFSGIKIYINKFKGLRIR